MTTYQVFGHLRPQERVVAPFHFDYDAVTEAIDQARYYFHAKDVQGVAITEMRSDGTGTSLFNAATGHDGELHASGMLASLIV